MKKKIIIISILMLSIIMLSGCTKVEVILGEGEITDKWLSVVYGGAEKGYFEINNEFHIRVS